MAEVPTPIFTSGRVYMVTNGGIVTCMDAASGKVLHRNRLGAGGSYFASPVVAGSNVYFMSNDGVATVIRDSASFEPVSRAAVGEQVFASPAVVDGTMYVRTVKMLRAYGGKKP